MLSSATKENAARLRNDVKLTASSLKEDAKEALDMQAASEFAHEAGRKARDYLGTANDQFSELTEKVNEEIHTNPMRSALIALGVGFVIGALLRR